MRATPLVGFAIAFAECLLLVPAAHAQVGDCPDDTCVESQTSLVYNAQTKMMDAFTSATTDYTTAYWYDLCVNLAVMRVNGPYVVNWDILLPSTTPSSCQSGAVELEETGSVAATPGRQYFAEGLVELYVYYTYSEIVYDCGEYCDGYYYDAEGYSLLSTSQPSNANWPSIEYSYPYLNQPEPVYQDALAMTGSGATAWAPPVIDSVSPNLWTAGTTTTFTISGAGFGYSPTLSVTGSGITGYTNPCVSNPSSSCDGTIVATVTIDASTPANSQETITVTAGGQNPSGFLPVDTGQAGQATAQATTQAAALVLQILFNGSDIANKGAPSCPGDPACVVVGQQIALVAKITLGGNPITPDSQQWTQPDGAVIANYVANQQSGTVFPFPNPNGTPADCQSTLTQTCLTFYWVDQGNGRTVTYSSTIGGKTGPTAIVTFNVTGPRATGSGGAFFAATPLSAVSIRPTGTPSLRMGTDYSPYNTAGIGFSATTDASGLSVGSKAKVIWVQLQIKSQVNERVATGTRICVPNGFANGQPNNTLPELDAYYPYPTPSDPNNTNDTPSAALSSSAGSLYELAKYFKATMYLMWDPALPSGCTPAVTDATNNNASSASTCTQSVPVPLATLTWSASGNAINALTAQLQGLPSNGTTWVLSCGGQPQAGACVASAPSSDSNKAFPVWYAVSANGARSQTNTCTNN